MQDIVNRVIKSSNNDSNMNGLLQFNHTCLATKVGRCLKCAFSRKKPL